MTDEIDDLSKAVDEIAPKPGEPSLIDSLPSVWRIDARQSWLVDGFLPKNSVILLTGDAGAGKSTFALSLAGAIAHGTQFLGRQTEHGRVLYLDRENPASTVRERLDRLSIAETSDLKIWGAWCDPQPEGPESRCVIEWVRANRPLAIFDSLIAFLDGDESNATEMRRHVQLYRNLANAGATIVLLHHSGKGESSRQYRGSSDLKAAVDSAYLLETVGGDSIDGLAELKLTPFKSRASIARPLRITFENGTFRESGEHVRTNREIVEQLVRDNPEATQGALVKMAGSAGVAKHRAEQVLNEGIRGGWLVVRLGAHGRKLYSLNIAEQGES